MASINFTDFDSKTSLLSGDFLVGYKQDGSAEFRTTIKDIVEYLKTIFIQKSNEPIYVTIDDNGFVMNLNTNEKYYFTVDETVNSFKFLVGGLDGVNLQNNFNINDFNDCNLGITTTNLIASDVPSLYVTQKCTLSTIKDEFFTLYYYNTGSLVLGFSLSSVELEPPTPTPEPTPEPTPTPTGTPVPPTPTPTGTPVPPTPTPTDLLSEYNKLWSGWDFNPFLEGKADFGIALIGQAPDQKENLLWVDGSIYIHKDLQIDYIMLRDNVIPPQSYNGSIFLKNECTRGIYVSNFSLSSIHVETECNNMSNLRVEGCPISLLEGFNNTNTPSLQYVDISNSKVKTLHLDDVTELVAIDSCFDISNSTLPNLKSLNISIIEDPDVENSTEINICNLSKLQTFSYDANHNNKQYITTDIVLDGTNNNKLEVFNLSRQNYIDGPLVPTTTIPLENVTVINGFCTSLIDLSIFGFLSAIKFENINLYFKNVENVTIVVAGLESLPALDFFDTEHNFSGNLNFHQFSTAHVIRNNFSESAIEDIINMLPDRTYSNDTLKNIYLPLSDDYIDERWTTLLEKGYTRGNFTWGKQHVSKNPNVVSESNVPYFG